jgi:hypothetical protein
MWWIAKAMTALALGAGLRAGMSLVDQPPTACNAGSYS